MITASPTIETTLVIKRTFAAPREAVFNAWTNPSSLKKWFAASDEYDTPTADVDLQVGGTFRLAMRHKEKGNMHVAIGTYREVHSPEKLVFSWAWEENRSEETLVTIHFRELDNSTEMTFKHERFITKEQRDMHEQGWVGCFKKLEDVLSVK